MADQEQHPANGNGNGADDYGAGQRHNLAFIQPVDARGNFPEAMPLIGGKFFKDADPIIIEELLRVLTRLFRDEGMTGIIVEQHAHKILPITDHAVVLERGRVVLEAPSAELLRDASPLERLLGVAGS